MRPDKKHKSALLYVSEGSDVGVYDYPSLKQVGTLTGFTGAGASCVDAKGDIYITESNGDVVEYAHGGTKVINTYAPGGDVLGCSVDTKNDLAVTSFSRGEAIVYAGGDPSKGTTYTDASCAYQWPMGYDDKGNLIGTGENTTIAVCALLAGSQSETTLTFSGGTIDYPGGTVWDGKYIVLGDQEAGGVFATGMYQTTLSGMTLTQVGKTVLTDNCYSDYVDVITPFVVGKKNTPVNHEQGAVVLGVNLWCADGGSYRLDFWHYPQGGAPYKYLTLTSSPAGASVSIGK